MNNSKKLREIKKRLEQIVNNHYYLSKSYSWLPRTTAEGRRYSELKHNDCYETNILGVTIHAENWYRESCKNVYYKGIFYIDDKKVTVKKIRSIKDDLDYIC